MKRRWLFVPFLIGILAIVVVAAAGTVSVVSSQADSDPTERDLESASLRQPLKAPLCSVATH